MTSTARRIGCVVLTMGTRPEQLRRAVDSLPEKERAKAMVELTRGMPPKYRDAIEAYFRELQNKSSSK